MTQSIKYNKIYNIFNKFMGFLAIALTLIGVVMFAFNPIISLYGHLVLFISACIWSYIALIYKDFMFLMFCIIFSIINILVFIFS